ncbi:nucleotidyltransferase domain-containing protein [Rossellomorea aquimaris]|uniref:Nucleotidyltransferase-like protein n=1 Tax=Rossellomorea aquimaris TaxID=189382 RepID=A0A366EMZ6_9BACI|nr:nucleotidyltransferase domain-containing protein [Rossellomorea aquimaris]RBP03346.1 nucleotidyltransferase-like protein [Rossellomorea aquimaris]
MGFESKHRNRDRHLDSKRLKLKESIQQDLEGDENVLAFFYGGSMGRGNHDHYSDLDLRIVVKDHVFEEYRKRKKARAGNWGDVLYYEDFPWAAHTVAHYTNFVKVDAFYYKREDLMPSLYLKDADIVYDPHRYVQDTVCASQALNYHVTLEEFELWRSKFFAHTHEVYRRINRGELYYALHSLDMMRWSVAAGWDMESGRAPNAPGDWSKYEGERSPFTQEQKKLLESWGCSRNPDEIYFVMKAIVPKFKLVHRSLCGKLGVEENGAWVDEILGMVL